MKTPRSHKVITAERGGGFAARCEVERNGVTHICDITFGGFSTRTEAREAIRHEVGLTEARRPSSRNTTTFACAPRAHADSRP